MSGPLGVNPRAPLPFRDRVTTPEIVATVAHELQTPLAAVRTAAAALEDPAARDDPATRARLVAIVRTGIEELQRLADDLLAAARLDAGRLEVRLEPCDALAVVRDVVDLLAATPAAAGREIAVREAPGLPAALADPGRLRQVVANLLANALAHGRGTVELGAAHRGDCVELTVTDEGPGIPAADRRLVFERYARLPGGSVRGSGLGLPIARELAEAMGGSLTIRDAGGGTAFVLELPSA